MRRCRKRDLEPGTEHSDSKGENEGDDFFQVRHGLRR